MNSLFSFLFSRKSLLVLAGISAIVFFASMYQRYIYIDDAWFGEQAFWLARDGIVKAVSIKDFFGWDEHLRVYHKLHTYIGAALITLFGWSVTPLRIFTLVVYLIFVILIIQYFRKRKLLIGNDAWVISLLFVLINPLLALYAYVFRPEVLVMTLGFASYVLLDVFITRKPKNSYIVGAGLLSGLAFLTHLNGMIFGMAGFVLLFWFKMYKQMFVFAFSTALVASIYFIELFPAGQFDAFLFQMANWPDPNGANYFSKNVMTLVMGVIEKLLNEHMRFFWSHKVWGFSSLFLIAVIFNFRYLKNNHRHLLVYLFSLILFLNIFGSQIAERFLLLFLPFMIICIVIAIGRLKESGHVFLKGLILALFALNIIGLALEYQDIFRRNGDIISKQNKIMTQIPATRDAILVSYPFIFNHLENRNLVIYKSFEYSQVKLGRVYSQNDFFAKSDALQIAYIIVPPDMTIGDDNRFPFLCDGIIDDNPWYDVFFRDSDYLILKRK